MSQARIDELTNEVYKLQKQLARIIEHSDKQSERLFMMHKELYSYKNHLQKKVQEEFAKAKEKERMLFEQSKLAAMGEMINAIAHQWKQPVSILKMQIEMLGYDFEFDEFGKSDIETFQHNANTQIAHMLNTLDEFRSFFKTNKDQKEFDVKKTIESVLFLMKDELMKNTVHTHIVEKNPIVIKGIENEFKHLLLNLIGNAKDAFEGKEIQNKSIELILLETKRHKKIIVKDNAGGIDAKVLEHIFKPNVTTKPEGKGTGIGLYIGTQIACKHQGTLHAKNYKKRAVFIFEQDKLALE